MIGERREDIVQVQVDSWFETMIAKYFTEHVGDRGEVLGNGNIYGQEEGQVVRPGEEVRGIDQRAIGGELGG